VIFRTQQERLSTGQSLELREQAMRKAQMISAAVLGFAGAIGAYGGFFIPKTFGTSMSMTGGPQAALYVFIAFYLSCILITWWWYARKGAEMPC
jgi:NNP family nitrate/nitrite transporter-like MFS transporter